MVAELEALHAVAQVVAVVEGVDGAGAVGEGPGGEEEVEGGGAVDGVFGLGGWGCGVEGGGGCGGEKEEEEEGEDEWCEVAGLDLHV